MKLVDKFSIITKEAIKLGFSQIDTKLPMGASKFGGKPDLPKGFEWYYFKGEGFDGEIKDRPLSFLAQINCREVKVYDKDSVLPNRGMIYFFYELATMTWGFDPRDKGSARVYYFEGDISELVTMDFPEDLEEDYRLPEIHINYSCKKDLPSYEEFTDFEEHENCDEYDEKRVEVGYEHDEEISKLLGYADIIQNSMQLQCEQVDSGIYCGNQVKVSNTELKLMKERSKEWELLFQLDTVSTEDFELMFGDCGRIYFFIRKCDLQDRRFDKAWLTLQC